MEDKVKNTSMALAQSNAEIYSQVDGLSLQNLFYVKNKAFPNCCMFKRENRSGDNYFDTQSMLDFLKKNVPEDENMQYIVYTMYNIETSEREIGFSVILNKSNIFARIEKAISESYILFGNDDEEALNKFVTMAKRFYIAPEEEKNNMYMVAAEQGNFRLNKWTIKEIKGFDIKKQYNDDFVQADEIIDDFISEDNKSGLVILHGEKGTGKTSYIRNLISKNPKRKFIFIPSNILPLLNDPSFGRFLMTLSDSVLILEDCEAAIKSRDEGDFSGSVSLLLNLCDGLMADYLHIKCICTFNADINKVDEALLRKGRLVCDYEFKKLNSYKVNTLIPEVINSKIDEINGKITECSLQGETDKCERLKKKVENLKECLGRENYKDMTLADIYNIEDKSYIKETKKIGFNG